MSLVAIRAALETRLAAIAPALETAWENAAFAPSSVIAPYQRVHVLFAEPDNREAGAAYQERGYMQVTLAYPLRAGAAGANARALLIRAAFAKGTSLVHSGITTIIDKTPVVGNGTVDVDRWSLVVKIPFHADIN